MDEQGDRVRRSGTQKVAFADPFGAGRPGAAEEAGTRAANGTQISCAATASGWFSCAASGWFSCAGVAANPQSAGAFAACACACAGAFAASNEAASVNKIRF